MKKEAEWSRAKIVAYTAILAAINAVFALLSAFFPFSAIFLMLVIPLTGAIAARILPLKHLPIFVLVALGVSLGASFWNFQNTIFYLFPSLIIGVSYGALQKTKIPEDCLYFILSLIECILFGFALLTIYWIYGISMEDVILAFLGLTKSEYMSHAFPLFCLGYSFAQMAITSVIMHLFEQRFKIETIKSISPKWIGFICGSIFASLGIALGFFYPIGGYFFIGCSFYWAVATTIDALPYKRSWFYLLLALAIFIAIIIFACLYSLCPKDSGLALCGVLPLGVICVNALNLRLSEKPREDTI